MAPIILPNAGLVCQMLLKNLTNLKNLHHVDTPGFWKRNEGGYSVEGLGIKDETSVRGLMSIIAKLEEARLSSAPAFAQRSLSSMQPLGIAHVKHFWLRAVDIQAVPVDKLPAPLGAAFTSMPNLETLTLLPM